VSDGAGAGGGSGARVRASADGLKGTAGASTGGRALPGVRGRLQAGRSVGARSGAGGSSTQFHTWGSGGPMQAPSTDEGTVIADGGHCMRGHLIPS